MLPVMLGSVKGYVASEYVYVTEEVLSTPAPTATPVPTQPPQAARMATVTAYSGLKLRQSPDMSAATLSTMPYGAVVATYGEEVNGFYAVTYGGVSGYASAQYLSFDGAAQPTAPVVTPTPTPVPPPTPDLSGNTGSAGERTGTVTAPSGLNLRAEASVSSDVLATLGYGVNVTVTGGVVNGFYPVRIGTLSGYVSADYVRFDTQNVQQATPTPTAPLIERITPTPQTQAYRVVVESDNGLNLRAQPNSQSDVLYVLPYGMVLEVISESENGFLYVQWANYKGYVSSEFVTPFGTP